MGQGDQVRRHQGGLKRGRREQSINPMRTAHLQKYSIISRPPKARLQFDGRWKTVGPLPSAAAFPAFGRFALLVQLHRLRPRPAPPSCSDLPFAARAAKEAATTSSPFVPITLPAAKAS